MTVAGAAVSLKAQKPHRAIDLKANEVKVRGLLSRMTLEEKVGQMVQANSASLKDLSDVENLFLGSILSGGSSDPKTGNGLVDWTDHYDSLQSRTQKTRLRIPLLYGIDAVHGHSNVLNAVIFPHNIGLGCSRNPALVERAARITAVETRATGINWTFAPCVTVPRDERWGRTYEGFGEDPEIVRSYAGPMIEGLQGRPGTPEFLGPGHVIATAKHFVGDGGTAGGRDQGDNPSTPAQLRDIHGAGYPPAVEAGVQAIMASFSLVRGQKVHGSRELLTGVIRDQMGFDGLVVGDWNAHGQVNGCTNVSCPASFNAGSPSPPRSSSRVAASLPANAAATR